MRSRRHAFTLVEVLISITLLAGLLAAGVALLFQFSSALAAQADDPVFERHADGVDRFLRAYRADGGDAPKGELKEESGLLPFVWVTPARSVPLLHHRPSPVSGEKAALSFKPGSGLWLAWRAGGASRGTSPTIERVLLSPWVVSAEVFRFDEKSNRWEPEMTDSRTTPDWRLVRITLSHSGRMRTLWIPWEPRQKQGGRVR